MLEDWIIRLHVRLQPEIQKRPVHPVHRPHCPRICVCSHRKHVCESLLRGKNALRQKERKGVWMNQTPLSMVGIIVTGPMKVYYLLVISLIPGMRCINAPECRILQNRSALRQNTPLRHGRDSYHTVPAHSYRDCCPSARHVPSFRARGRPVR